MTKVYSSSKTYCRLLAVCFSLDAGQRFGRATRKDGTTQGVARTSSPNLFSCVPPSNRERSRYVRRELALLKPISFTLSAIGRVCPEENEFLQITKLRSEPITEEMVN